jgi:hypothetical protein
MTTFDGPAASLKARSGALVVRGGVSVAGNRIDQSTTEATCIR